MNRYERLQQSREGILFFVLAIFMDMAMHRLVWV